MGRYGAAMKQKYFCKIKIFHMDNSGSTMVETLVAFVVLMIVLVALYGMIRFSSNLRMRAVDTSDVRNIFSREIYKSTPDTTKVDEKEYVGKFAPDRTTMFSLKPNTEKTDAFNMINNYEYTDPGYSLRLPCIDAKGYKSLDQRISEENLPTPKVICFEYNKTKGQPGD